MFLNNLKPFSHSAKNGIRLFSALRSNTPTSSLNFFQGNQNLLTQSREEVAQSYVDFITSSAKQGCKDSAIHLDHLQQFRDNKTEAVFLSGKNLQLRKSDKSREGFLKFLSDMVAQITNHIPQSENNTEEILTSRKPKQNLEEEKIITPILLPHTDDIFRPDRLELLALIGIDADYANFRTALLNHTEIVNKLDPQTLQILQEKIFYNQEYGEKNSPIISKNGSDYLISFSTMPDINFWNFELEKSSKKITDNEVTNALESLKETTLDVYKNSKLEEFYVGINDVLCITNKLHVRDQKGVPKENLDKYRFLISNAYVKKPDPKISEATIENQKLDYENQK